MAKKRKKKSKKLEPGHLVEKTIGSSNEISFNVLEQIKNETTEETSQDPWVMPTSEVQAKKKSRRRIRFVVILMFVIIILFALISLTVFIAGFLEKQNGTAGRLRSEVENVVSTSEKNDAFRETIKGIFISSTDGFDTQTIEETFNKKLDDANKNINSLEKNENNISELLKSLATDFQKTLGNDALNLISKEKDLVSRANSSKEYVNEFLEQRKLAQEGYSYIASCQTCDAEATELFLKGNIDDANKALEKANEAQENASKAKEKFDQLASKDTNFSSYVNYCQIKIEAQEASKAAISAFISREKDVMNEQNNKYNELQTKAQEIADGWSKLPYEEIDGKFYEKREVDQEAFKLDLSQREAAYKELTSELKRNE